MLASLPAWYSGSHAVACSPSSFSSFLTSLYPFSFPIPFSFFPSCPHLLPPMKLEAKDALLAFELMQRALLLAILTEKPTLVGQSTSNSD